MVTYYKLSGKVNKVYFALVAASVIAMAVLSVIYAIVIYYDPSVQLNVLITILVGFLTGIGIGRLALYGKLRNAVLWAFTVLLLFAVFTYVHLAAYAAVVFRDTAAVIDLELFLFFLSAPDILFGEAYAIIISEGVWSYSENSEVIRGIQLILIWVGEHCIVLIAAFRCAYESIFVRPFFEDGEEWGVKIISERIWGCLSKDEWQKARTALENRNADYFSLLPEVDHSQPSRCVMSYFTNPKQENPDKVYLSLQNIRITEKRKRKMEIKERFIVKNLEVPYSFVRRLEELRSYPTLPTKNI